MNQKTSLDPQGISNKMLKHVGPAMVTAILNLFNKCLNNSQVPKAWNHSLVIMLHKKGQDEKTVPFWSH